VTTEPFVPDAFERPGGLADPLVRASVDLSFMRIASALRMVPRTGSGPQHPSSTADEDALARVAGSPTDRLPPWGADGTSGARTTPLPPAA